MNLSEHLSQELYKKYEIITKEQEKYETETVRFYNEGIAILKEKSAAQEVYNLIPFSKINEIRCHK